MIQKNNQQLGTYLKQLRLMRKMSIRQLALKSGVSNAYISQIEIGKKPPPQPAVIEKLAHALGVTFEELIMRTGYVMTENEALLSLAQRLNEAVADSKKVNLDDFQNAEFYLNGKLVDPTLMALSIEHLRRLTVLMNEHRSQ